MTVAAFTLEIGWRLFVVLLVIAWCAFLLSVAIITDRPVRGLPRPSSDKWQHPKAPER